MCVYCKYIKILIINFIKRVFYKELPDKSQLAVSGLGVWVNVLTAVCLCFQGTELWWNWGGDGPRAHACL